MSAKGILATTTFAVSLACAGNAHATTVNKALAGAAKCNGKGVAARVGCYAKAIAKAPFTVDPACLDKAEAKFDGGADPAKACYAKLKPPYVTDADPTELVGPHTDEIASFVASVDSALGGLATGTKCESARIKCIGKLVAGLFGCHAKAAGKGGILDVAVGGCLDKARVKFNDPAKGCFAKPLLKPPCNPIPLSIDAGQQMAEDYVAGIMCHLDPRSPTSTCGGPGCLGGAPNGTLDAGEICDPLAAPPNNTCPNVDNANFPCNNNCSCECPAGIEFEADNTDPQTILDVGWTGISHDAGVQSRGKITVAASGGSSGNGRPCGTVDLGGPLNNINADNGDLHSMRCSGDTSIKCEDDTPDCAGVGTCEVFFGSLLPLSAGGVATCVANEVNGDITGTANIETGESISTLNLTSRVWLGLSLDSPCPRCLGDGTPNDGVPGGVCSGGARNGLACDTNGTSTTVSFGTTSLDCPVTIGTPGSGAIANLPIPLGSSTDTVIRTLSSANPNCRATGYTTNKCLCDTCDNAAATPCSTNAECVAVGATTCGGKRCVGGANNGAPCSVNSQCPGSSCAVPGIPTAPNACAPPDGAPDGCVAGVGANEGDCADGPVDLNCAPPEQHRGCTIPTQLVDCPVTGTCLPKLRECFLDNGVAGGSIVADGMADPPINDTSNPTLGALFCVGLTASASINSTWGLPGPGRLTLEVSAKCHRPWAPPDPGPGLYLKKKNPGTCECNSGDQLNKRVWGVFPWKRCRIDSETMYAYPNGSCCYCYRD